MSESLYFVGILPPEEIASEIQEMKYDIRDHYGSSHSLNAPPHITLLSPFRSSKEDLWLLSDVLKEVAENHQPFSLQLKNFDCFKPRVVFVDLISAKALKNLQSDLEQAIRNHDREFAYRYEKRPFHPHITLAFKDLSTDQFEQLWEDFKHRNYEATFSCSSICLLKHQDKKWTVVQEFLLGSFGTQS